jgi:TolB-like protein
MLNARYLRVALTLSVVCVLAVTPVGAQPADRPAPDSALPSRVAILPFDNLGGAPGDDWIGAGLVETLATALGALDDTTVLSHVRAGAIFEQLGSEPTDDVAAASLGRELSARWVVAGSYLRQGRQLRITARLVDTVNDILADMVTTSGTLDELFDLQDQIALELTAGVRPDAGAPPGALAEQPTAKTELPERRHIRAGRGGPGWRIRRLE